MMGYSFDLKKLVFVLNLFQLDSMQLIIERFYFSGVFFDDVEVRNIMLDFDFVANGEELSINGATLEQSEGMVYCLGGSLSMEDKVYTEFLRDGFSYLYWDIKLYSLSKHPVNYHFICQKACFWLGLQIYAIIAGNGLSSKLQTQNNITYLNFSENASLLTHNFDILLLEPSMLVQSYIVLTYFVLKCTNVGGFCCDESFLVEMSKRRVDAMVLGGIQDDVQAPEFCILQYFRMNKLGKDIIETYKPYQNRSSKLKITKISQETFQIDDRYQIIDVIGQGAYGFVVAAKDKQANNQYSSIVAIKKICKAFQHKIFAKRTIRELRILRLLNHQNLIKIQKLLLPKSREDFNDVYVVSELMDADLTKIIKSDQQLTDDHHRLFLFQILKGLKYLHQSQIVHRDLKPRNILVNSNCDIKICDFGLAKPILMQVKAKIMTDYMTTRWYRAPELLFGAPHYTTAVDIWSVGCIFAELLRRKPFLQGSDSQNQLELIQQNLGTIKVEEIKGITQANKSLIEKLPKTKGKDFSVLFPKALPEALDLLKKMLVFNPDKRITAKQALAHPYFSDYADQLDGPIGQPVDPLEFQFQNYNLTNQQLKDLLYEEILLYHSKQFKSMYEEKKKEKKSLISHIVKNSNGKNIDVDADAD